MSKVNVEFDTQTKEMSVKVNNEDITDVHYISFSNRGSYGEDEEFSFSLSRGTRDKTDGITKTECLYAAEAAQAGLLINKGAIKHPNHPDLLLLKGLGENVVVAKSLGEQLAQHRNRRRA